MHSLERLERFALLGELNPDGALCPACDGLPLDLHARDSGLAGIVVPEANVAEAAGVTGWTCAARRR